MQQINKKIVYHDQVGFIPWIQGWFNIYKPINAIQHINRSRTKITWSSQDMQKKSLTTIIHDKNPEENRLRRSLSQHDKSNLSLTYCQHHIKWGKTEILSSKIWNKTRRFITTTLDQHSPWNISQSDQKRKKRGGYVEERQCENIIICRWNDYVQDPKTSTKRLLELMTKFSRIAGYKNKYTKVSSIPIY